MISYRQYLEPWSYGRKSIRGGVSLAVNQSFYFAYKVLDIVYIAYF